MSVEIKIGNIKLKDAGNERLKVAFGIDENITEILLKSESLKKRMVDIVSDFENILIDLTNREEEERLKKQKKTKIIELD